MDAIQKRANSSAPKSLQVAAAVIGNALEWYDFIIFGFGGFAPFYVTWFCGHRFADCTGILRDFWSCSQFNIGLLCC
jgi:hypothetical protein